MLISNKRAWAADRLCESGIVRLLERFARRPGLVTLVYHRVGEASTDPFYRPLVTAPEVFERQMRQLRDAFRVIGLEELGSRSEESGRVELTEPTALITFDDGYRDNATVAAPILANLGLQAALFVTTVFVDHEHALPWWDRVAYAVQASPRSTLQLNRPRVTMIELPADRAKAVQRVVGLFIADAWHAAESDLAHLEARAAIDPQTRDVVASRLFLDRGELAALASTGFSIGAHTHTHRRLLGLSATDQDEELRVPKALLEQWLGRPVNAVAYPYGAPGSFDAGTKARARAAGYAFGFALDPRPLRPGPIDRWALPRFSVGQADSSNLLRARLALASSLDRSPL
jgi:peptidoglycan/xylan/chitin deacetylase (PgdA/CDA1 family)